MMPSVRPQGTGWLFTRGDGSSCFVSDWVMMNAEHVVLPSVL